MNKLDLITTLRNETDLTKPEATAVVHLFFNEMANALAEGDRVEIRGLCSFYIKEYKGYTGRNPKTGHRFRLNLRSYRFTRLKRVEEANGSLINH